MNIYYSKEPVNFILLQHNSILYSVVGPSLSPSLYQQIKAFSCYRRDYMSKLSIGKEGGFNNY